MKMGFIGTGNMGKPMAMNLIKAGHQLTVYDKRREAADELVAQGARWADTPKAVTQASEMTITSLPGPPDVEEVTLGRDGILEGAAVGHFYIDMSTNYPSTIRRVAAIAAEKGVEVLDAPVTGGVRGARKATLTIMVGGKKSAFEHCEPVLKCMGERVFHVGDVGAGCVAKLVNNMMSLSNALVAMEAMVMGVKAGVDPQKLFEVVDSGSGSSYIMRGLFPYIIFKGKFDPPSFSLTLAAKDLRLGTEYARELGIPLQVIQSACEVLAEGVKQGLGGQDMGACVKLVEKAAGIELRTKE